MLSTSFAFGVIAMCSAWRRAKANVEIPEPVSKVLLCSDTESKRKRAIRDRRRDTQAPCSKCSQHRDSEESCAARKRFELSPRWKAGNSAKIFSSRALLV